MGDPGPLEAFQDAFQGKFNSHTELAIKLTVQLLGESMNAMAMDASFHGASEAVHMKPLVGQAFSATVKYHMLRRNMIKMISTGKEKATVLHLGAVVPQVVFNVL
jgi:phospholipase/lecithinase/hemolysin